eukprot:GHVU01110676.1.p1 GENE.GHVU01110676.1~~GHVU01110676.1.p1  ORF type:complete len:560 (+),score=51.17 GHVU01110676.1:1080-2759(+)
MLSHSVTCAGIPFRVVASPYFHSLIDAVRRLPLDVDLQLPTRDTVSGPLLDAVTTGIKEELQRLQGRSQEVFGTTVCHDSWSSALQQGFSNLTTTTKGVEVFEACWWDTRKTAEVIAEQVKGVIVKLGVDFVVHVCVDGAATISFPLLRVEFPLIFFTRCVTHLLDLLKADIGKIPVFKKALAKARSTSLFLLHRGALLLLLKLFTHLRPRTACDTRFAVHTLLISRLLDIQHAIKKLVNTHDWREWVDRQKPKAKLNAKRFRFRVLRDSFWASLQLVFTVFLPILRFLRSTDSHKAGLSGKYLVRWAQLRRELTAAAACFGPDVQAQVVRLATERQLESHDPLYSIAFVLHPRYVGDNHTELVGSEWAPRVQRDWLDFVARLDHADRSAVLESKGLFDFSLGAFAHSVAVEQRRSMSPHMWWYHFGTEHPVLQRIACRVLSVAISASACERDWSLFSFALSKRRLCMSAEKAADLVACMSHKIALQNVRKNAHLLDRDSTEESPPDDANDPWAPPEESDDEAAALAPCIRPDPSDADSVIGGSEAEDLIPRHVDDDLA